MLRRVFILLIALCLSGCVFIPMPHRAVVTPEVSGTIESRSESVSGVPVKVCVADRDACCSGPEAESRTTSAGAFAVEHTSRMRFFMAVMAHKHFYWCLSVAINGTWHSAGPYQQYTLVDTGPAFPEQLSCEFESGEFVCERLLRRAGGI
jgi:hypothetical protein